MDVQQRRRCHALAAPPITFPVSLGSALRRAWCAAVLFLLACGAPACAGAERSLFHGADSPLRNTYWKLTHFSDLPATTAARQREPHLIFAAHEQRVHDSGGCNRVTGSFAVDGDKLRLSRMASTRMACPEGMAQEQRFLQSLNQVEHYRVGGDRLELLDASGTVVARFVAVALR